MSRGEPAFAECPNGAILRTEMVLTAARVV
jgi:hypothetical protein